MYIHVNVYVYLHVHVYIMCCICAHMHIYVNVMYMHRHKEYLLEWLAVYFSASPTRTVYLWKIQESSRGSDHEAGHLSWSLVKEWICQRELGERIGKETNLLPYALYRLPTEGVNQNKGGSPQLKRSGLKMLFHLKRSGIKVGLPTSDDLTKKKSLTGVPNHLSCG